jgi:hypothetical protein
MEWISVEDKTPDTSRAVIGLCDDGYGSIFKLYYLPEHDVWIYYADGERYDDVTHWIEIPHYIPHKTD